MPVYNRENYLEKSLGSLRFLNDLEYELILVDDGSTDNSVKKSKEILKNLSIDYYRIIELKENKGVSYARNKGIDNSKGEYILFLDSDDELLEGACNLLNQGMSSNIDVCCFGYIINGVKSPKPRQSNLFLDFVDNKFSNTNTILCKKIVFNEMRFQEGYPIGEDTDLWARILFSEYSKKYFPGYLAYYNFEPRAKYAEIHPFFDITLPNLDIDIKLKDEIYRKYLKHKDYLEATNRKTSLNKILLKRDFILLFLYIFEQNGFKIIWNIRQLIKRLFK
ncbi:glycosyltransferase family 2 protein [Acinetobacter indicus]|nr:glycosyltransferase [Acinetobacter indicus]MCO8105499.1 glycosyltransferase [Acinetobacter indicus]